MIFHGQVLIPAICFVLCGSFQAWEFLRTEDGPQARARTLFKSVRSGWVTVSSAAKPRNMPASRLLQCTMYNTPRVVMFIKLDLLENQDFCCCCFLTICFHHRKSTSIDCIDRSRRDLSINPTSGVTGTVVSKKSSWKKMISRW